MLNGSSRQATTFGRAGAVAFSLLIGAALFAALFPWFPGRQRLTAGATAADTVIALRAGSYESEVLTAERRQQAADAVQDVWVLDPDVRVGQLIELDSQLARIDVARRDTSLSASARESEIRAVSPSLSQRAAVAFAQTTDAEWQALVAEARTALDATLTGALRADDLQAARRRAEGLLSPLLSAGQALAITDLLDQLIVPTLVVDQARTQVLRDEAMESQPPVRVTVARGEVVVAEGQQLTAADIERLERLGPRRSGVRWPELSATAIFALLIGAASGGYLLAAQPAALGSLRRRMLFALLLLAPALAAKLALPLLLPDDARHFLVYAIPLAAAPIAAAVLLDVAVALLLTALLAAVAAFVTVYVPADGGVVAALETARVWLTVSAASLAGVYVAARADRLQRYLMAGIASALAAGTALLAIWFLDADRGAADLLWMAAATASSGVLSAMIAVGAFVLLSRPFGIITRVELMELAQLSHPLLRRLQDDAPGTFQHSMLVGNLAERAADLIGADPLLVRVGAYYHDIGKLVAPAFFVENAPPGESPHEALDPLQSTRVIHQHVTGGIEIARRERLPQAVAQFIPQHHGTRLMTFFYRRAAEVDPDVDPELFRYPGPKPQSREAALVMLADASEATVRASSDHSAERIRDLIDQVISERIEEREFNQCDISLRDLAVVADSFASTLNAVYHPRVEYPEPTERERAERGREAPATARPPGAEPLAEPDGDRRPDASAEFADEPPPPPSRPAAPAAREQELSEDDT